MKNRNLTLQRRTVLLLPDSGKLKGQMLIKLLTLMFFVASSLVSSAQDVKELKSMLAAMRTSADPAVVKEAAHLEDLVYNQQPGIRINKGNIRTTAGDPMLVASVDAASLGRLRENNPLFRTVEIIIIRLNNADDLNFVLDPTKLSGFNNLKYIHLQVKFDCDPVGLGILFTPVTGLVNPLILTYLISIPS